MPSDETTRLLTVDGKDESGDLGGNKFQDGCYSDEDSIASEDLLRLSSTDESEDDEEKLLSVFEISCILSSAFAYGCVMTTLFLITLPVECERIERQFPGIPKSVSWAHESSSAKYYLPLSSEIPTFRSCLYPLFNSNII